MKRRVFLGQHALFSPFGALKETVDALLEGKSAIKADPLFNLDIATAQFPDVRFRDLKFAAVAMAGQINLAEIDQGSTLFIFCAAKGDIRSLENDTRLSLPSPRLDEQARSVTSLLQLQPARTVVVSNACASGAVAVEIAKEYLEQGVFDTAILFGFDCISHFVMSGFHSLGALSPTGARPFDAQRDGLTLGEGVAMAILHTKESDSGNCVVAGAGSSNDANHRTGPSRTGEGLLRAATAACSDACVEYSQIGAVKCHGTATVYNDAMEAKAINSLFGEKIPPCFSIKGALGHTSGSGSLLELILASHFLQRKIVPPTAQFQTPGVEEPLPVSAGTQSFQGNSILCLSAGFGGLNSAILLKDPI